MPITNSPLRYPGGKSKLKLSVESIIKSNNLVGSTYVEPFAGGAAVALYLLFNNTVNNVIINDYDISIYAFWYSVLNFTDELCDMIARTEVSMSEWERQKEIQDNKCKESDMLSLGFSTFFLNRTNRSGIIKAGVMGGKKQEGNYKIDCRYNKTDLIRKIRLIGKHRDRVRLFNLDTVDLIINVIEELDNNCFVFFDPPYYQKGQSLYVNFYTHDDHERLATEISRIRDKSWIVSYDNVHEIIKLYDNYDSFEYDLSYTIQEKYKGKEVMFFSDNLIPLERLI